MISLHRRAPRGTLPQITESPISTCLSGLTRMLKHSPSRNQRPKGVKLNLALQMLLAMAIGVWMIYQLRLFLSHKLPSENGGLVKDEAGSTQQLKLGLGRRGLVMPVVVTKGEGKSETGQEVEDEDEIVETEYLAERGGDDEDEGLDMDPLEESDLQNDDDDEKTSRLERNTEADDDDDSTRLKKDARKY